MQLYDEIEKTFPMIEKLFTEENLTKFKNVPVSQLCMYHFGLGSWIRNNLLSDNSRLYHLFLESGIEHPDEMSMFMVRMFHYYQARKKDSAQI